MPGATSHLGHGEAENLSRSACALRGERTPCRESTMTSSRRASEAGACAQASCEDGSMQKKRRTRGLGRQSRDAARGISMDHRRRVYRGGGENGQIVKDCQAQSEERPVTYCRQT